MGHFFIDGYNVIRAVDWLGGGKLRDQRERLLHFIEKQKPQGRAASVTVVFDGRTDVDSPRWMGPTRVLYSHGPDADQIIKDKVDGLPNPGDAVVVTNDRAIQRWVRAAGAKIMSCEEFLRAGAAPRARRGVALDPDDAEAINEELKRLWKLK